VARRRTCETMAGTHTKQLVVCIDNEGYAVSLEKRKIYIALRDAAAAKHGLLRVVDESGEDYLYPKKSFRPIALPLAVRRAVLAA
jgi:TPP-dependent pyruvate/acetoin dehydrogenase alpha subunit